MLQFQGFIGNFKRWIKQMGIVAYQANHTRFRDNTQEPFKI